MRALSRAFSVDVREKLTNHQIREAVASGLSTFRLGKKCYRGGLTIDLLLGLAVQSVAINELRQLVAEDQTSRAEILQRLVPMLETGESAEEVFQRELRHIRRAPRGYIGWMVRLNLGKMMEPSVQAARRAALRTTAQQRLFVIHLALQTYRDEHDSWPDMLAELAPGILTNVPADPYGKAPFVYRVENGNYRLYSVGENLVDDGGEADETVLGPDVTYDLTTDDDAQ